MREREKEGEERSYKLTDVAGITSVACKLIPLNDVGNVGIFTKKSKLHILGMNSQGQD